LKEKKKLSFLCPVSICPSSHSVLGNPSESDLYCPAVFSKRMMHRIKKETLTFSVIQGAKEGVGWSWSLV
jgi:hypothetical protein